MHWKNKVQTANQILANQVLFSKQQSLTCWKNQILHIWCENNIQGLIRASGKPMRDVMKEYAMQFFLLFFPSNIILSVWTYQEYMWAGTPTSTK
jgi:hypothetical protein